MKGLVAIHDWLRRDADTRDPATMHFVARLAKPDRDACAGCVFRGQTVATCRTASQLAVRAGWPDCETVDPDTGRTYVYMLPNPKQSDWVATVEGTAP